MTYFFFFLAMTTTFIPIFSQIQVTGSCSLFIFVTNGHINDNEVSVVTLFLFHLYHRFQHQDKNRTPSLTYLSLTENLQNKIVLNNGDPFTKHFIC